MVNKNKQHHKFSILTLCIFNIWPAKT